MQPPAVAVDVCVVVVVVTAVCACVRASCSHGARAERMEAEGRASTGPSGVRQVEALRGGGTLRRRVDGAENSCKSTADVCVCV